MKGQGPPENLDGEGLKAPKMISPFALQSIFLTLSIPEHPPFTGNIPSPGDFHAQTAGDGSGVKR
jgi:hypothetical protein